MKKIIVIVIYFCSCILKGQTPANDQHWSLLWEDNFNTINTSVWEVKNNYDHYGGEPQVYTNRVDNVFIDNGNMVLRCKQEAYSCPPAALNSLECARQYSLGVPYAYTSGCIQTFPAYNPQFGYMEARIKSPDGNGLWPAFWTFSGIAGYQEIDIFEMVPGAEEYCHRDADQHLWHTKNIMTSNIHSLGPDGNCNDPYDEGSVLSIQDYTQWHTYGLEWSPSKIVWYVDGYPIKYYLNSQITAPTTIILNLAVNKGVSVTSSFPADMLIDYVRVYELKKDCNDYINAFTYDFLTYNNREKNFIKIGEGGGVNVLPIGQDIKLRASQYVDFSGDFSVPLGAALYADANHECSTDLSINCTQAFNPCNYNFASYNNSIKQMINLGNGTCNETINSTSTPIILQATSEIVLRSGVSINTANTTYTEMKIVSCP